MSASVSPASAHTSTGDVGPTDDLGLLAEMSRHLDAQPSEEDAIDAVLRLLEDRRALSPACLMLVDRGLEQLVLDRAPSSSTPPRERTTGYALGEGVLGRVAASGAPLTLPQRGLAPELDRLELKPEQDGWTHGFVAVPVRYRDEVIGVLAANQPPSRRKQASDSDVAMLNVAARMLAPFAAARQAKMAKTAQPKDGQRLLGRSKAMRAVLDAVATVAPSDTTVLILGESGTGKELVADAIHRASPRRNQPFIRVNCSALPEGVLESELFGHEEGAFTGALRQRVGRFEAADGGTIFLDEIGDIPAAMQITLLRVLQERTLQRVGGNGDVPVNVRIIAATHRDLPQAMGNGTFREDLYYRLNVFPIRTPVLRDRRTDIPLLADHFVERYARANHKAVRRISSRAIDMLMAYHWPGNVRELENCIERAVLLCSDSVLDGRHLPPTLQMSEGSSTETKGSLESTLLAVERDLIEDALKRARGNMAAAARDLGLTERKMGLRVRKHGINPRKRRILT